jgi:pimeloyl-ACP methyl ester carboxylesterase
MQAAIGPIEARRVGVGDVELHCEIAGSGAPILFLHGLGSCSEDWQEQIARFSNGYRAIACDLRGHGTSSKPRGPYSIEAFARDIAALLRELKAAPAHVVGLSLGGMVAFQLAVDAPELVRSLVIVNSGPAVPAETFKHRLPLYIRLVYAHTLGLRGMAEKMATRLFPKPEQVELRSAFVERLAANDKRCYLASLRAIFAGWSVVDRLPGIRCPVLVLASDQDYTPVSLKQAYAALLPDSRVVVVPDSRHALPLEKPDEFNEAVADFLAGVASADAVCPAAHAALSGETS